MEEERNRPTVNNQMGLESDESCPNNEIVNAKWTCNPNARMHSYFLIKSIND
jgi:hypothetical protein